MELGGKTVVAILEHAEATSPWILLKTPTNSEVYSRPTETQRVGPESVFYKPSQFYYDTLKFETIFYGHYQIANFKCLKQNLVFCPP
jgi:hypothetical protein